MILSDDKAEYYNRNYTFEEISAVVEQVHRLAQAKKVAFPGLSRPKQQQFMLEYTLKVKDIRILLQQIQAEDFCYSIVSRHPGRIGDILYVFGPYYDLKRDTSAGAGNETVDRTSTCIQVYVKLRFDSNVNSKVVLISFHAPSSQLSYLFEDKRADGNSLQ